MEFSLGRKILNSWPQKSLKFSHAFARLFDHMTSNPKCSSVRSNGSSTYRRIASKSSVDESLFGSRGSGPAPSSACHDGKITAKASPVRSASISLNELQRIKELASTSLAHPHQTDDDETPHDPKAIQKEASEARKDYMKQLELKEMEEQKKMGYQCDKARLDRIRKQAQEKIEDEQDIVKLMKTCSGRAMTFAIRDQQLKDKAECEKKEHDYEQRMILAMEIDRLRAIEAREVEEAHKLQKMIDARKIIENQIEQRRQDRILLEEARDEESRGMLERIKLYQAQDEEKARARRENALQAGLDIRRANEEHIASKRERRLIEKREDEMMAAYLVEQDEKMRQREAEAVEAERKRTLEFKIQQERMVDRRSEMDELRERRAMEDAERKFRQKQLMEAQKKKRDMDTLDMARMQQQQEKLRQKQMEIEQKREEYSSAIGQSRAMAERERTEAAFSKKKNYELIKNLQEQIEQNESRRMALEKEKFHEGLMIKQQLAEERVKLEAIRDKMVRDMKSKGIDERYFGEITSLDIGRSF
ncbi:hypothetical protein ACHAW5_003793 [Stephanodiscus triporus]|uniref:Cilia- and flagella-associated protein 45 n=1 Tax=Stephanodiscus triporus TaxID=2934178 RepID=A0ABD3P1M2_9STRA